MGKDDPLDLAKFRLPDDLIREQQAVVPRKIQKRREHFVRVPWRWVESLAGARYIATYRVALHLLYQHWKGNGRPISLANGMLGREGVTRGGKWRALGELEQLGLITVERRPRKSPLITILVV